jgi:hypothetical protein
MDKPKIKGNGNEIAHKPEQKPAKQTNYELLLLEDKEGELLARLQQKLRILRANASQLIEKV